MRYFLSLLIVILVALNIWMVFHIFHRKPSIDAPLPQTSEEMQTPPDLFPTQPHDVKG